MGLCCQRLIVLCCVLSSAPIAILAQGPPPPPGGGEGQFPPMPKPQNLKILPKGISNSDLLAIMRGYRVQLGVECAYCHAGNPATHKLNFASDAKPEKATARLMMTMTDGLNARYISHLPTGSDQKVTCATCHRGHAMPEEFVPPPESKPQ